MKARNEGRRERVNARTTVLHYLRLWLIIYTHAGDHNKRCNKDLCRIKHGVVGTCAVVVIATGASEAG